MALEKLKYEACFSFGSERNSFRFPFLNFHAFF